MIPFPSIWWLFPAVALAFISLSFLLTRSGKLENETIRKSLVGVGAMLGFLGLALPFFEQPTFKSPLVQYGFGWPLLILGLLGRVYPSFYLRHKGTTTTLDEVEKLVDSGPYAWVRHPQYSAGLVMLLGWFLAWGSWYALGWLPLIAGMIYAQAWIEEKYILEKVFGDAYAAYREQVGMLLPRLAEKDPLRITTSFLGVYAGLIAIQHGIFEVLQGNISPDGLLFNAIGPPCLPEMVWHACFPAMTLIPNLLVSGMMAVLVGLGMTVWASAFVGRRRSELVIGSLSLLALLVGGGFVPVFIGMVAAIASRGLGRSSSRPRQAYLAALWPWPLVVMALWLPGSWLLGHFFSPVMLSVSGSLFLVFDISLPVLAAVSGLARSKSIEGKLMNNHLQSTGFLSCGLPYVRAGKGPKPLIIFQGLTFENKPQPWMAFGYGFLKKEYTLYTVLRKPGLPQVYTLMDMADDYAQMIRREFCGPVDVIGISTGGSIALSFAADHPDLVRRLVIHSSAHRLNENAKQLQMDVARLAQQGHWTKAWSKLVATIYPQMGFGKWLTQPLVWLSAGLLSLNPPKDASDLVVTVMAEDKFTFKDRLSEITAPTLVAGGMNDFFYSPALFRETADGIPNAKLCLYEDMGHPAGGKQFQRDVLAFLSN